MSKTPITFYLVVPCFNEEEQLPETIRQLTKKLYRMEDCGLISNNSRIVFVDDGSRDQTWQLIVNAHEADPIVEGLKLSRNCGHQNAVLAGLMTVRNRCDAAVTLDADLQDDIEVLEQFLEEYGKGSQIVYGVRSSRKTDSFFKRISAQGFYRFLKTMGVQIVYNHADYRLMSRQALEELSGYQEVNLFLRGIVPLLGFQTGTVFYERKERQAGKSKYPLKKMLALAFDGLTSFSMRPLRLITALGVLLFLSSLILLAIFLSKYWMGVTVPGWATIVLSIWGIGGLQLLAIGMIGEYTGKIYMETKRRPRYFIETILDEGKETE